MAVAGLCLFAVSGTAFWWALKNYEGKQYCAGLFHQATCLVNLMVGYGLLVN